jgi:hypothetical protein
MQYVAVFVFQIPEAGALGRILGINGDCRGGLVHLSWNPTQF